MIYEVTTINFNMLITHNNQERKIFIYTYVLTQDRQRSIISSHQEKKTVMAYEKKAFPTKQ